jgi:hypothetical protein
MTALTFSVLDIVAEPYTVAPQLTARLQVTETTGTTIHAIALRCQVRIEPQRRGYTEAEEVGLLALFGERSRWRDTLRPFLWMQCTAMVQGFSDQTSLDLTLPCTYDFEVTGSKYLHALREGTIPLALLFSGTIFTRGANGFGVEQVAWLRLDRDVIEAVARYRAERGLTSWDATIESLLAAVGQRVP